MLVRAELAKLCSPIGDVESIHIAPYVDGPRENKLRNAFKVRRCASLLSESEEHVLHGAQGLRPAACDTYKAVAKSARCLQVHAGWAHVTYADLDAAQRAVAQLPGSNLLGNRIRAHFAQPEPVAPVLPDPAVLAAKQELIAVRKAQYHRRRARRVSLLCDMYYEQ